MTKQRRPKGDQNESEVNLTKEQSAAVAASFPDFVKKVNELDPHWQGNCHALTSWKKAQCARLLDSPPFANVTDDEIEKIRAVIMRKFTNYFNYAMKKQSVGKPKDFSGVQPTASSPAFMAFTGKVNPRQFFLMKNQPEITDRYRSLAKSEGIRPVVAFQRVAKEMWDDADQDEWERMAEEVESDVDTNCYEFQSLITNEFRNLLERGVLGSFAVSLSFAWRNNRNMIEGGNIDVAFDSNTGQISENHFEHDEDSQKRWSDHVDNILPRQMAKISTKFERTNTGLPLFPKVDLKMTTMDVLVAILDDYFLALWDYTQDGATEVPWEKIEVDPWRYFDDTIFRFPQRLQRPSSLGVCEIFAIAQYLITITISEKNPFTFLDKADIIEEIPLQTTAPPPRSPRPQTPAPPPHSPRPHSPRPQTPSPPPRPSTLGARSQTPPTQRPQIPLPTRLQTPPPPAVTKNATAISLTTTTNKGGKTGKNRGRPKATISSDPAPPPRSPRPQTPPPPPHSPRPQTPSLPPHPSTPGARSQTPPTQRPQIPLPTRLQTPPPPAVTKNDTAVSLTMTMNKGGKTGKNRGRPKATISSDPTGNVNTPTPIIDHEISTAAPPNAAPRRPERKRKVPSFRPEPVVDPHQPPRKKTKASERWEIVHSPEK